MGGCFCFSSFQFWPDFHSFWFEFFKYIFLALLFGVFIYQFYRLKLWKYQFELSRNQEVRVVGDSSLYVAKKLWVAPWLCGFYVVNQNGKFMSLVFIFNDMLDDTDYRNLCRILLSSED
ncbi:hypothetical protein D5R81_17670 [Parashewanella spongiae]|uniref:Uncharacterized protein n=1 Tax=Parashewanella spongiae TaxID=342950 RepID=A0A3A6TEN1_9GAMM|nr:hypothetical protein D5R81_17670 [Parashewanella spongiae]